MKCGLSWCGGTATQRLIGSGPLCQLHVELALEAEARLNRATGRQHALIFEPLEEPSDMNCLVEPALTHGPDTFRDVYTGEEVS